MAQTENNARASLPSLRQVPLLDGERLQQAFSPRDGLVGDASAAGPLLALTDRRLIAFTDEDGRRETTVLPVESVGAARIKITGRSAKPLTQGLALVIVGIIVYLALGTFVVEGLPIPLAVGGGIVLVGLLFILRYVFWEEEGSLGFQSGTWELDFPFTSTKASADAYALLERYFRVRAAVTNSHAASAGVAPEAPTPMSRNTAAAAAPPVDTAPSTPAPAQAPTSGPPPASQAAPSMQDETAATAAPPPASSEPAAPAAQDETAATAVQPPASYPPPLEPWPKPSQGTGEPQKPEQGPERPPQP